ncbi:kinase-like domain-containing protein, partial [Baffinella frigidus]
GSLFSNLHCKQLHFSVARKLEFARGIITGMAYVHDQRVLHRDLSSRNILLTADWQIKITDWGCARQVAGDEYHSSTISGSPTYMAPEQLAGDALTFKIDVWALGCVLWEMLMERTPW